MTFSIIIFAISTNGSGMAISDFGSYGSFAICESARVDLERQLANPPPVQNGAQFSYRLICERKT